MARWQLMEPHYLNVPGTKWELQITDRSTGRPNRHQFNVPMHLDPNIEQDWNYREMVGTNIVDGKIIVCHEGKGEPKDIVFVGPCTPGMMPLDAEARALSAKLDKPITQGLDELSQANGWQQQLLIELSGMKEQVSAAPKVEGMSEFMKTMAEMMRTQTSLLAAIATKGEEPALVPPDDVLPLEDPDPVTEADIAASAAVVDRRPPARRRV